MEGQIGRPDCLSFGRGYRTVAAGMIASRHSDQSAAVVAEIVERRMCAQRVMPEVNRMWRGSGKWFRF